MKLKSLLIGSAASIVAITGAQAADLPTAEPVEYVAICDAYGAGYFFIPGGDTCLKISGFAFYEAAYADEDGVFDAGAVPGDDVGHYGTRARGEVRFDAKTSTDLGVLTGTIRLRGNNDLRPEFNTGPGAGVTGSGNGVILQEAYLTLEMTTGQMTAGLTSSAFDFFGSYNNDTLGFFDDPTGELNMIAYSAMFGSFRATISVEDPQTGVHTRGDSGGAFGEDFDTGGRHYPDLVGALAYEQAWGAIQLSGAIGSVEDISSNQEELGWALALGGRVGFGIFEASVQGTYAEGLIGYATTLPGVAQVDDAEAVGGISNNNAWSVRGGVEAGLTDAISIGVSGSYAQYDDEDGPQDSDTWGVIGDVNYTLVPGLVLTGEAVYQEVNNDGPGASGADGERWGVAGRVRRNF